MPKEKKLNRLPREVDEYLMEQALKDEAGQDPRVNNDK